MESKKKHRLSVGKALQLRHENRLTVKEPVLTEDVIPLLGDGQQEPYKEPIRLNFDDEIEPGKRRMHSGASGRLIGRAVGAVIATAAMAAHQKVHEVENENSAVRSRFSAISRKAPLMPIRGSFLKISRSLSRRS